MEELDEIRARLSAEWDASVAEELATLAAMPDALETMRRLDEWIASHQGQEGEEPLAFGSSALFVIRSMEKRGWTLDHVFEEEELWLTRTVRLGAEHAREVRLAWLRACERVEVLRARFSREKASYEALSTEERHGVPGTDLIRRITATYEELRRAGEVTALKHGRPAVWDDPDAVESYISRLRATVGKALEAEREERRQAALEARRTARPAGQGVDVLCARCEKRPRHFDDLCKRCANELGVRPTGKVE